MPKISTLVKAVSHLAFVISFFTSTLLVGNLSAQDSPAFSLQYPGDTNVINYSKYGRFELKGTANYRYVITDMEGLQMAMGEGIFPANEFVKKTADFRRYEKAGELRGSHWDFLQDPNLQRAFYKWSTADDDPGIKMLFAGNILKSAGLYKHALKAYYSLILHHPLTVGWSPAGDFYWFAAPAALANIRQICEQHPELGMSLEGAIIDIKPKVPGKTTATRFIKEEYHIKIDPGKWVAKKMEKKVADRTIVGWVPNENAKIKYAKHKDGTFQFYIDGQPSFIKGAGGTSKLAELKASGGNAIRTWGHDGPADALKVLDDANKHGLKVCLGFWIDHERHQFDYNDLARVEKRFNEFKAVIDAVKDHPALLMYGIGNEVNHMSKNPKVWDQINAVAKYAHSVDPNHPTATIVMGFGEEVKKHLAERCPEVDIIGVNSYGGLEGEIVGASMSGLGKPIMATEWGVNGYWEVPLTPWKAPIEQPSGVKAKTYQSRYKAIESADKCIGSFVFLWGSKQERTHTWFNLFMEDGSPTEMVDVMINAWTGAYPAKRAPHVKKLEITGFEDQTKLYIDRSKKYTALLHCTIPDPKYTVSWELYKESQATETGGDKEIKPELIQLNHTKKGESIEFTSPAEPGAYRLFGYIKDSSGKVGYANVPFYVN